VCAVKATPDLCGTHAFLAASPVQEFFVLKDVTEGLRWRRPWTPHQKKPQPAYRLGCTFNLGFLDWAAGDGAG
jgi:hypothetical protein